MHTVPYFRIPRVFIAVAIALLFAAARPVAAGERLCDPSFQNCRTQLLQLIDNETRGIDVAFWFMEDNTYVQHLAAKWKAGVPIRLLVDSRGSASSPYNQGILNTFASLGIPMRQRIAPSILHWKTMLFAGQGVVEFSGANYSDNAWRPVSAYTNYVDESIFFTDDASVVHSFETKFDSSWVNTTSFANYANITTTPTRKYPKYAIDPELNFPPGDSYATRSITEYGKEAAGIDAIMYRITDGDQVNGIIAARKRGVPVRLITEPKEYRDPKRLWDAWNVDRLWKAGVKIRIRNHSGLNHQKSVILHGLDEVIFGSSNWSSASDQYQQEHNYFVSTKAWMFDWFRNQFERKWNNTNPIGAIETKKFYPLPPDVPKYKGPANAAYGVARALKLKWYGGPWAHYYDIYFGTSATPPLWKYKVNLGPSDNTSDYQSYYVSGLAAHTTYYWRIVSRTAAGKTASGAVWSFQTGG